MPTSLRLPRKHNTVPGVSYGTPKEIWGFRLARARGSATQIAREFLKTNADLLGLSGLRFRKPRYIRSAAAEHVIFPQFVAKRPIHRGYVTVHLDHKRRVYMAKNRAAPITIVAEATENFHLGRAEARRIARHLLRGKDATLRIIDALEYWFPHGKKLLPAYRVRVQRKTLRTRSEEIVFIDARTGRTLSRYDNLAEGNISARLFDPSPLARVADWRTLATTPRKGTDNARGAVKPSPATYRAVTLRNLPNSGQLNGTRASTSLTKNRVRLTAPFTLANDRREFEEVMAWFHVDRAIRYVESLGYRGQRKVFDKPLRINARGSSQDNSWYSPGDRSLTFGTGGINDAEDGEIIVHEFGHALQDAICPGFGQSPQAAAMGEGFGDYLAGSTFAARKPPALRDLVMSWDAFELSDEEPPRLRALSSPLTFESFDHSDDAEHENGVIWSATLWEIWNALGKKVADRIIIESHFQLDGFTTFARGARAILDADRNLYAGRHVTKLSRIFSRRGIGPIE